MYRAIKQKNNMSTTDYLELKGRSLWARTSFWTKLYFGAGLAAAGLLAYNRIDWDGSKAAAELERQEKERQTEARRLEALPAYLAGKSFAPLDEDDGSPNSNSGGEDATCPFEGASPAEIQALAARYWEQQKKDGAAAGQARRWTLPVFDQADPFEGMSPEEIDAYVSRQGGL